MRGTLRRDEEAVSSVIATVLLLAITVMLSSMVFVLMQGALTTVEKIATTSVTVSVRSLDNGFHVVRITGLDQSIDPARSAIRPAPCKSHRVLAHSRAKLPMRTSMGSSVPIFHSMTETLVIR